MAGESPDRSKQHESSATASLSSSGEPTTGTAAAVPGPTRGAGPASPSAPVDPRLAVARERAATVRVDQATAVFSTRALRDGTDGVDGVGSDGSSSSEGSSDSGPGSGPGPEEPEGRAPGDARLRAAVAAWVATADEDTDPDAGAVSAASGAGTADEEPEARGDGTPGGDRAPTSVDSTPGGATGADEEPEGEARPEAGAEATDADGAANAASAVGAAAVVTEVSGEPGTADEPQSVVGAEKAPTRTSAGDGAADVVPLGTEPEVDADADADSGARRKSDAERPAAAAEGASGGAAGAGAKPAAVASGTGSVSTRATDADAGPGTGAEPEVGAGADSGARATADAEQSVAAAGAEGASGRAVGPGAGTGTEPEVGVGADSGAKPKTDTERPAAAAEAESASGHAVGAGAGAKPAAVASGTGSVSTRATDADAGSGTGTEPEVGAGADSDAKPKPEAERPAAAADVGSPSGRDANAERAAGDGASDGVEPPAAEAASASVRDADADADADAVDPKAAEGDSGEAPAGPGPKGSAASPKAPEAPSGEPRPPEAPKAAATPEQPRVDQPTAVFKAPRRPAVDQPTTMLKLGDAKPPAEKPKATEKPQPDAQPRPQSKAEAPAERTSKFVALKPLDERAPAKPKPDPAVAGGTAALPQVGPARPQAGPERTTQQPLPPKPPLDLLAELTNTPPPRQTPVRTIVRRVKIWTPLVILLAVIFAVVQAVRPLPAAALTLTADATYTFEGGTLDLPWPGQGQSAIEVEGVGSLGTDGKQTSAPIASVAKIMTAYVILQEHPLKGDEGGEKITVDQQAEDESKNVDESTAPMTKGQQFTERQMLQLLMIPSGNNAARLLARWDSDDKTFVAKMNDAAKKLGMTNSTYTDPSGLEETTVSTATDQLKLAKEVMQNPVFASIVGMGSAKIPGLDGIIYNNNDLLVNQVGVIGLKTGSSTPAGGNLVWAATKTVNGKTQTVYGAVLGQNAGTGKVWDSLKLALTNSQKLIDTVQQGLTSATVVKKGDVVGYVDDQLGGQTPVVATKDMTAVGWPGLKTKLAIGTASGDTVPHSGKAGTVVGELTVGDGSDHAVTIPVALQSDLAEPGFGAKLTRVG